MAGLITQSMSGRPASGLMFFLGMDTEPPRAGIIAMTRGWAAIFAVWCAAGLRHQPADDSRTLGSFLGAAERISSPPYPVFFHPVLKWRPG